MNPLDKNAPLTYLSVGEMKETELIIEKSRFLGFAFPVQTIEEIDSLLLSIVKSIAMPTMCVMLTVLVPVG